MRWAAKRDLSHDEVRDTLKAMGFDVFEVNGAIDFLVRVGDCVKLVDAKTSRKAGGKDTLTKKQRELVDAGWPLFFAHDSAEAEALARRWRQR